MTVATHSSILYFGPEPWDGMWRNRHHLLSRLSNDRKVMYVEPRLGLKALRRKLATKEIGWLDVLQDFFKSHVSTRKENLHVFRPPLWAPVSGRPGLKGITLWFWSRAVNKAARKLGLGAPDVWLCRPDMADYLQRFRAKTITYHVVDEYLAYSGVGASNLEARKKAEVKILKAADRVIVVSENLYKSRVRHNSNTFVVPNAVDYEAYYHVAQATNPRPPDISDLKGPILGYSGLISARLDLSCLCHLAETFPQCQVVLMGEVSRSNIGDNLDRLQSMDNVHFIGAKDIQEVPHYVKCFTVCLIPYVNSQETDNLSPLKLYDYMALGKPIVATRFPAAMEFSDKMYLANNSVEFIDSVRKALGEENSSLVEKRKEIARANSWDVRVKQLSAVLSGSMVHGKNV